MKLIQNMNLRSNPILFQGFSLLCISRIPAHQFVFPVYLAGITEDDDLRLAAGRKGQDKEFQDDIFQFEQVAHFSFRLIGKQGGVFGSI